jgi:tetratricopeptide (TPR) repeat protein
VTFVASSRLPQAEPAADGSFWQWLLALGREPGVVELGLSLLVLGTAFVFWWRLSALVRDARSRQALADYLLGVEQALHGDLDGAHARLQKVVQNDPENHYARLLLGKVLAQRGEAAEAHKQHVVLKTAFGIDSDENDLMLAASLLAAGQPREAAEAAERALQHAGDRPDGHSFVYRARLQCGDFAGALPAGRRLLELLPEGAARQRHRLDLARTLALAGGERVRAGDVAGATALLRHAERLGADSDAIRLLAARVEAAQHGLATVTAALLAPPTASEGNRLQVAIAGRALATSTPAAPSAVVGLVPAERWRCRACQAPLANRLVECPRCGAADTAELEEPLLVADLASPLQAMDAIDVNESHVQRLVRALLDGEGADRQRARRELLELRAVAVPVLLRAAWHANGPGQDALVEVLRAMGPSIAPALFAASDDLANQRLLPLGSRSPGALVGRVVQGFDRSALPHVEPLFASARPEHRKILIDFFLGLHDTAQFQLVLERFPPTEIVHRLNKADAEVLRRFLHVVPPGHFIAEVLLRESTFCRDDVLLAAIPGAEQPHVLRAVMVARGASTSAVQALIAGLAVPEQADEAERILGELGAAALEFVLAAFADPEVPADERQRLQRVLVRCGPAAAAEVCDSFGPEPTAFDDALREVLTGIGDPAVQALQSAYERSGWLERVSIGLISRHTNRRVQIVLALRAIASPDAATALRALAEAERDANLRLRLQQALHELDSRPRGAGGDHGPR